MRYSPKLNCKGFVGETARAIGKYGAVNGVFSPESPCSWSIFLCRAPSCSVSSSSSPARNARSWLFSFSWLSSCSPSLRRKQTSMFNYMDFKKVVILFECPKTSNTHSWRSGTAYYLLPIRGPITATGLVECELRLCFFAWLAGLPAFLRLDSVFLWTLRFLRWSTEAIVRKKCISDKSLFSG